MYAHVVGGKVAAAALIQTPKRQSTKRKNKEERQAAAAPFHYSMQQQQQHTTNIQHDIQNIIAQLTSIRLPDDVSTTSSTSSLPLAQLISTAYTFNQAIQQHNNISYGTPIYLSS